MNSNNRNLFDNPDFFAAYKALRDNKLSANEVEEKPALFQLLPNLKGKKILDLGCGYGENCIKFIEAGAANVVGVDISEKMLEVANRIYSHPKINYKKMNMEDISSIDEKFDIVISSLAIHYICDFDKLIKNIRDLICNNGYFIFSQEHPMATAPKNGVNLIKENDSVVGSIISDYSKEGLRDITWLIEHVVKYHRTTATILNTLIANGFIIEKISEPTVPDNVIAVEKSLSRCIHAPDYLMVRAVINLTN